MGNEREGSDALSTGIRIMHVRIRNFRCLRSVDVTLSDEVLLIGQNSSGKTSFLAALHLAVGSGQRTAGEEDIFITATETSPPRDRTATVDILLRPTNQDGTVAEFFPQGSPWLELWGPGIGQDDNEDDFVGLRTQVRWHAVRGEYVTDRKFLGSWEEDPAKWDEAKTMERQGNVRASQLEPIELHYIDAKRDIASDISGRGSHWQTMVGDPGLNPESLHELEESLNAINARILEESPVLGHVQSHLDGIHETVTSRPGSVRITPISRNLRDIRRGMDVVLASEDGPTMPIGRQGMGTRSISSILTFRAFVDWRQQAHNEGGYHPTIAIEEPETHLQPQAQRALMRSIQKMRAQRIVSTHSPYVCSQTSIDNFRHFATTPTGTRVTALQDEDNPLTDRDIRKINREVLNTRGELLFARGLLLFEGETEEQAMPEIAEQYWGQHIHELGISMIGVGGHTRYLPFLRLARRFQIPWFILSDGEDDALAQVETALQSENLPPIANNPQVFVLPDGQDFEGFAAEEMQDTVTSMLTNENATNAQHAAAIAARYEQMTTEELADELRSQKTRYGAAIGRHVRDHGAQTPQTLLNLFQRMSNDIRITARTDAQ